MNKVLKFTDPKRVREQAGEYLARLDAGASADDLEQIRCWLAEHPRHRDIFLEMAALWDQLTVLATLSDVFPLTEYARSPAKAPVRSRWGWAGPAVAMTLVVAVAWFLREPALEPVTPGVTESSGVVQQFHETSIGEQATITLPDQSVVILNTNTVIEVVYSENTRNIFLTRGEGLFTVTKDPSRPFRVYAGYRMVEAIGTTFSVLHTHPDNVEVVVKEGAVNFLRLLATMQPQTMPANVEDILNRNESMPLTAGESATDKNAEAVIIEKTRIQPDDLEVKLAWTHGMLLFQDEALEDVLGEISRYTTTKIEVDESIRDMGISGYFRANDIDGFLVTLQDNFRIESEKLADDRIVLRASN